MKSGQLTSAASIPLIVSFFIFLIALSEKSIIKNYKKYYYIIKKSVNCMNSNFFFLQRGGGHRPKGSLLPSGRKRHVYPDGPAGHCSGQIDACAAARTAAAQAILRLCMLQLLSGTVCVTPAFHLCGPSSSFKMSLLCLVTSNAIPL